MSAYSVTISMILPFGSVVRAPSDLLARKQMMKILYEAMKLVVELVEECAMKGVASNIKQLVVWLHVP